MEIGSIIFLSLRQTYGIWEVVVIAYVWEYSEVTGYFDVTHIETKIVSNVPRVAIVTCFFRLAYFEPETLIGIGK